MSVCFNGISDVVVTFQTASAAIGDLVAVSANKTVEKPVHPTAFAAWLFQKRWILSG